MKTTHFKMVVQRTTEEHSILMAVIPNDMLGKMPHDICEMEVFMMPQTIYAGTYPQIKVNTDTVTPRPDLAGLGANGILTQPIWAIKEISYADYLGISLSQDIKVADIITENPEDFENIGSDLH